MEYERKRKRGSPAEFVGLEGVGRRPDRLDRLLEAACSGHVVGITRHVTKGSTCTTSRATITFTPA